MKCKTCEGKLMIETQKGITKPCPDYHTTGVVSKTFAPDINVGSNKAQAEIEQLKQQYDDDERTLIKQANRIKELEQQIEDMTKEHLILGEESNKLLIKCESLKCCGNCGRNRECSCNNGRYICDDWQPKEEI